MQTKKITAYNLIETLKTVNEETEKVDDKLISPLIEQLKIEYAEDLNYVILTFT